MEELFTLDSSALERLRTLYNNREDHRYPLCMTYKDKTYKFSSQSKPSQSRTYTIGGVELTISNDLAKKVEGGFLLYYGLRNGGFELITRGDLEARLGKGSSSQTPDASDEPR